MIPTLEYSEEANFSAVLPGGCNARCEFCFWSRSECESPLYVQQLAWYLDRLNVNQISLTGGEPCISPVLRDVLGVLDRRDLKVVLTTNGHGLLAMIPHMEGVVDHINISRHDASDSVNNFVFDTASVPQRGELKKLCSVANMAGIDVTLNRVVLPDWDSSVEFYDFVNFSQDVGASALTIRKDYRGDCLNMTPVESGLGYVGKERSCPVCVTTSYVINGLPVHFKRSLEETDSDGLHEFVYHPDGRLTSDWAGEREIEWQQKFAFKEFSGPRVIPMVSGPGAAEPIGRIVVQHNGLCHQPSRSC